MNFGFLVPVVVVLWAVDPVVTSPLDEGQPKIEKLKEEMEKENLNSNWAPDIWEGAKTGNLEGVEYWYSKDPASIDYRYSDWPYNGWSLLHIASRYGHLKIVEFLMSKGVNVDVEAEYKDTPLMLASEEGNVVMIKYLISKGAQVNKQNKDLQTVLHKAINYYYKDNNLPAIKVLISLGADSKIKDKFDRTPLDLAIQYGTHESLFDPIKDYLSSLLKIETNEIEDENLKVKPNIQELGKEMEEKLFEQNWTSDIWNAARKCSLQGVQYWYSKDPTSINRSHNRVASLSPGWTPLHAASHYGHLEIVEFLLSKGANVDVEADNKETPLMLATEEANVPMIRYLISKGAQVNKQDLFLRTALQLAVDKGSLHTVKVLISLGADPKMKNQSNDTPLDRAKFFNHKSIQEYLLSLE